MSPALTPQSTSCLDPYDPLRYFVKSVLWVIVFNTIIAFFLRLVGAFDAHFTVLFVISQCVGLSICLSIKALLYLFHPSSVPMQVSLHLGAILLGTLIGISTSTRLVGDSLQEAWRQSSPKGQILFLGLFFGAIITYFFISRQRVTQSEIEARDERLRRVTLEKLATETELKLLQAQIEPHFLFNTLSNLTSLLETDVDTARRMLDNLIHYLRTSLAASRLDSITLGQEFDLILAYLQIYQVRMGERLQFDLLLPESLRSTPFSPMLIQPLVENAIKHGLEPKVDGGQIRLEVSQDDEQLIIQVVDSGLGLRDEGSSGVGLDNVRQRLAALYGGGGRLTLDGNGQGGVTAIIEVPYG